MDQIEIHRAWGSLRKNGSHPPFLPAAQPVSLQKRHIKMLYTNNYYVSEKVDGIRMALTCNSNFIGFINRKFDIIPVNFEVPDCFRRGTILDGEMLDDGTYMVYDVIVICGKSVKHLNFNMRLFYIHKYLKDLHIKIKKFYSINNLECLLNNVSSNSVDGLIFTPWDEPVRVGTNDRMFKWKSLENITIDFRVENGKTYIQNRNRPVYVSNPSWARDYPDNSIVECCYSDKKWIPIKIRDDKDYPNSVITFDNTLMSIREDVSVQDILHPL